MRRQIALIAIGLSIVVAVPVAAHASASDCGAQRVCLWDGNDQAGFPIWTSNAGPGTCVNLPASVNNRANSFYNRLLTNPNNPDGYHFTAYSDANCTGHNLHRAFGGQGPFKRQTVANFSIEDQNILSSIFMNTG